jgi:carboxyl-terminal processing protease
MAAPALRDALEEQQRIKASSKQRTPLVYGSKDDFQLAQALNHFKGLPVTLSKVKAKPAKEADLMDKSMSERNAKPKLDAPVDIPAQK